MVAGNHSSTGVYHPSEKTRILSLPMGDLGGLVPGQKFITSQSYNPQMHRDGNSPRPENIEFPLPEGVGYVHQHNSGNVFAPSSTGNNDLIHETVMNSISPMSICINLHLMRARNRTTSQEVVT